MISTCDLNINPAGRWRPLARILITNRLISKVGCNWFLFRIKLCKIWFWSYQRWRLQVVVKYTAWVSFCILVIANSSSLFNAHGPCIALPKAPFAMRHLLFPRRSQNSGVVCDRAKNTIKPRWLEVGFELSEFIIKNCTQNTAPSSG
jgi:hypothetical protein